MVAVLMRLERARGIEPPSLAWEASALPLSYARTYIVHHYTNKTFYLQEIK